MILADNGSSWFVSGATDPRWNDDDLHALATITGNNFEAVDESGLMVNVNSGQTTASTPAITVSINPTAVSVTAGNSVQFAATVANATSQTVTWSVNGVAGGNATVGTINAGVYTAPATVPSGGAVTVTATSTVATSISASATVTITAPFAPTTPTDPTSPTDPTTPTTPTSPTSTSPTPTSPTSTSPTTPTTPTSPAAAVPVLSGVTPNYVKRGRTANVTIVGSNFTSDMTVTVRGLRIISRNVVVVNSTTITAQIATVNSTPRGTDALTVTNSVGTSNAIGFTVK